MPADETRCWPCAVGYPDLLDDFDCAVGPHPEHGPEEVALALALVLALAVAAGTEPQPDVELAQLAVCFLECDTSGIVHDLGPHASWAVTFDEDREGATINGVRFTMRYDVDGNSTLVPEPPAMACPECSESVGWADCTGQQTPSGFADLECRGCFAVVTVAEWWPRLVPKASS